eukprot:COSAG01_NODE_36792_length_512_cov_1.777240_1_plen_38_part_10
MVELGILTNEDKLPAKPFFYFMPGYPGASRAFAIRKLV